MKNGIITLKVWHLILLEKVPFLGHLAEIRSIA